MSVDITTAYAYDSLSRLTDLTNSWAGHFGFSYDELSRSTQMTRPNGVNTAYQYDSLSRLLSVLHQANGTTIDGASYVVDAAGNRTAKTDLQANVTSNYGYDDVYQLLQATQGATTSESYSYDPTGNRLSSLGMSPNNYNASNQLISTPSATYVYDSNGNTLGKTDASGVTGYAWDVENRLTSVTLANGGVVAFKYDPLGRRIQKSSASGTMNYLYDGANIITELDASGNTVAKYTQGLGIDQPLAMSRGGTTRFYHVDGLGSVTSLTDFSGTIASSYAYDSFGNGNVLSGTVVNPIRYTGRELDSETGLYFYRARYYDGSAGRFISEDQTGFAAGVNFYVYVLNEPVNATDPTGLVIKICTRAGWQNLQSILPGGVANHVYFLNTLTGENCGKGNQSGKENPTSPGTVCVEVPGSAGNEEKVMECCRKRKFGIDKPFLPFFNNCHNSVSNCLKAAGLQSPGTPGGRWGDRCSSPECRVGPWLSSIAEQAPKHNRASTDGVEGSK